MRYVTYVLTPERGYLDPGEVVFRDHGVVLASIRDVDVLNDGTVVMRYAIADGAEHIDASLADAGGKVVDYQVADGGDTTVLQIQYYPSDLIRDLLDLHSSFGVLLDYPLEFVDSATSSLRVSEVGPEEELRQLIAATRETIDVSVEQIGSYDPVEDRRLGQLTDRQRQVLRTAVERGYYELPRRTTYEEIAADLDCSASAVGRHLRRIEVELVGGVVPDPRADPTESADERAR
ncbi:MAG: helix-turn-helix domain-containing protein [Haloarculaceae archaeon]